MATGFWQSRLILHWVLSNPSPQEGAVEPSLFAEAFGLVQHSSPAAFVPTRSDNAPNL